MATFLDERMQTHGRLVARQAGLEERFAGLLPELVMTATPEQLAVVAARALTPKVPPTVAVDHLHAVQVSVREQATIVTSKLRRSEQLTFAQLVADAPDLPQAAQLARLAGKRGAAEIAGLVPCAAGDIRISASIRGSWRSDASAWKAPREWPARTTRL